MRPLNGREQNLTTCLREDADLLLILASSFLAKTSNEEKFSQFFFLLSLYHKFNKLFDVLSIFISLSRVCGKCIRLAKGKNGSFFNIAY